MQLSSILAAGTDGSLFTALLQVVSSVWNLVVTLLGDIVPWTPLIAWIAFWLLAVNWVKLRETLASGGWIGVVLIAVVAVLVWGSVSPGSGTFDFFGLKISNYVEKTVYVSGLICIMFLAGALQLTGFCGSLCDFEEPVHIADLHGGGHDHGHEHAHAGDAHGHH